MPINEAARATGNRLTREQREAMDRLTLIPEEAGMTQNNFGESIIDLNRPPSVPYHFSKFPMLVYDHKKSLGPRSEQRSTPMGIEVIELGPKYVARTVSSEEELQEALAGGWKDVAPKFAVKG